MAVALGLLSACSQSEQPHLDESSQDATQPESGQADATGTEHPVQLLEGNPEQTGALSTEELSQVLLTAAELPDPPDGHSTHTGAQWLEDHFVESDMYRDSFGDTACAEAMDTINSDLVGDGPGAGLLHEYRLDDDDGDAALLYVWALSFSDSAEVNSSQRWGDLVSACEAEPLGNDEERRDIFPLTQDPFDGMSLQVYLQDADEPAAEVFTVSADLGANLIVLSAVDLDEDAFLEIVDRQITKLDDVSY